MNQHPRSIQRRLVGALAVGALVLAACGDDDDTSDDTPAEEPGDDTSATEPAADEPAEDASGETARIFMAPKFTGLAYFEVARAGGEQAAEDYPIEFEYIGSDKPEATEQIATLTNAVPQEPDALVVSAIDGDAVAPALREARDAGIAVVTYDADAAVDARDLFVNQLSYELAAETMLEAALLNSPDGGQVAFISASPTAPNHTAHVEFMKEKIDNDERYSSLSYIDEVQFAGDDATKSQEIALNLIQANPDLKVIISSSAVSAPAAQQAIVNAGLEGQVWATGFALPSSVRDFIENGSSEAFALWDPAELGYVATVAAYQLATGQITAEEGQVIDAGEAGTYTVGPDGEVLYDKPLMFTSENIADFDF